MVSFARHSVWAPNLQTLNPSNFQNSLNDGHPWLIDFYAPWCPPCLRLIPEFRKVLVVFPTIYHSTFKYVLTGQQFSWWYREIWFIGLLSLPRPMRHSQRPVVSYAHLLQLHDAAHLLGPNGQSRYCHFCRRYSSSTWYSKIICFL